MAINSIGYSDSLFGQAVLNLNNQLTNLSTQLATGEKSTTYSGHGRQRGLRDRRALAACPTFPRSPTPSPTSTPPSAPPIPRCSRCRASRTRCRATRPTTPQTINSTGQTIGQQNAQTPNCLRWWAFSTPRSATAIIFSGSAINTPSVASIDQILNGTGTQAGLKQVIAERAQADGTDRARPPGDLDTGADRTAPATTTSFSVAEDVAGSPFGLKLSSVSSIADGRDGDRSLRFAGSGVVQLRRDQSQSRRSGHPQLQSARRHHSSVQLTATNQIRRRPAVSLIATTSTGAPAGHNGAEFEHRAEYRDRDAGEYDAGRGVRGCRGQRFLRSFEQRDRSGRHQPADAAAAPITSATALSGTAGTNSRSASFASRRHHHGQRHDHQFFGDRPDQHVAGAPMSSTRRRARSATCCRLSTRSPAARCLRASIAAPSRSIPRAPPVFRSRLRLRPRRTRSRHWVSRRPRALRPRTRASPPYQRSNRRCASRARAR